MKRTTKVIGLPAASRRVNPLPQLAWRKMHIYERIIRENGARKMLRGPSAAIPCQTVAWGTPDRLFASDVSARDFSEKIDDLLATPNPTVPCAQMHIIHFGRAIMHDDRPMRLLRGAR